MVAEPSAVSSYATDSNGNWDQTAATPVTFTASGLVHETVYYSDTTAGEQTPGDAEGYIAYQVDRKADGHSYRVFASVAAVTQTNLDNDDAAVTASYTYYAHTGSTSAAGDQTIYPVATQTTYPDNQLTNGVTTTYAYSWYSGSASFQVKEVRTTLPAVSAGENGSGVAAVTFQYYNDEGQLVWSADANGRFTHYSYDSTTGLLITTLADVDSGDGYTLPGAYNATTNPAGLYFVSGTGASGAFWPSLPASGQGASQQTDYQRDALGRVTQTLGPVHTADIDGTPTVIRTATWNVYYDVNDGTNHHQSWSAQGYAEYDSSTSQWDIFTMVGPVSITRTDLVGHVTDKIQATWSGTVAAFLAAEPTGTPNPFPQTSYVTWTSYQYGNQRLVGMCVYHDIPASGTGTAGTYYDQTIYGYESYGVRVTRAGRTKPSPPTARSPAWCSTPAATIAANVDGHQRHRRHGRRSQRRFRRSKRRQQYGRGLQFHLRRRRELVDQHVLRQCQHFLHDPLPVRLARSADRRLDPGRRSDALRL